MTHRWSRRLIALTLAGTFLAAFPGVSLGDTFRVRAKACDTPSKWCWGPAFRHIEKGDVIRWKNPTDVNHTVTGYKNFSKNVTLAPGERTSKKFRRAGEFLYRCTIHSTLSPSGECTGMCGTIHVTS